MLTYIYIYIYVYINESSHQSPDFQGLNMSAADDTDGRNLRGG